MHDECQDVIDFCKDVGLQSSTAATRNSTIKLIGILHKFVGPGTVVMRSSFFKDVSEYLILLS